MWSRSLWLRAAAHNDSLWSPYEWPNDSLPSAEPLSRGLPVSSVRDVSNVLGVTARGSGWGPVVRRPVAWVTALVLFAEAIGVALLNWFLGVVVDRQDMSLAGLDPDT